MSKDTQKFVKGSLILSIAAFVAKILSAFFRIPLTNLIGDIGMAYYGYGYPIYTLFTAIAIVGIPSSVAKLVAEKRAEGQYKEAHDIFKHTMRVMIILGVVMAFLLGAGAPFLIRLFHWEEQTIYSLWGLSLSPLFVCIMGVYRGFFQGMQEMFPTAVSQVLENLGRVVVGLLLATLFLPNIGLAAGGASFGAVAGGLCGAFVLFMFYQKKKGGIQKEIESQKQAVCIPFKENAKRVLWIAMPISIGAAVNSVMNFLDSALVPRRLVESGFTQIDATTAFGQLTKVATFINFPLTFGMALVIGLVPAISEAIAKKDGEEVQSKIELGSRFALLIALPASVGLSVLAAPIMKLMYPEASSGSSILAVAAFTIGFTMLGQAFTGILQGMGKVFEPVKALLIAAVIKAILNYLLVGSSLGIIGAPIASIVGYGVFALYSYRAIKKETLFKLKLNLVVIKPALASLIMGIGVFITYKGLIKMFTGSSMIHQGIVTLGAVSVGGILYILFIALLGGVTKEDIRQIRNK